MSEGKGNYRHMRIEPAENGVSIEYTIVHKKPSRPDSTFDYDDRYEEKQELFSTNNGALSMEKTIDMALARYKELLMANMGIASKMEEEGS